MFAVRQVKAKITELLSRLEEFYGLQEPSWPTEPYACPFCGENDKLRITSFATPDGTYRVTACQSCLRYLKTLDGRRAGRPVMPVVDAIATLPLDAVVMQRGFRNG